MDKSRVITESKRDKYIEFIQKELQLDSSLCSTFSEKDPMKVDFLINFHKRIEGNKQNKSKLFNAFNMVLYIEDKEKVDIKNIPTISNLKCTIDSLFNEKFSLDEVEEKFDLNDFNNFITVKGSDISKEKIEEFSKEENVKMIGSFFFQSNEIKETVFVEIFCENLEQFKILVEGVIFKKQLRDEQKKSCKFFLFLKSIDKKY